MESSGGDSGERFRSSLERPVVVPLGDDCCGEVVSLHSILFKHIVGSIVHASTLTAPPRKQSVPVSPTGEHPTRPTTAARVREALSGFDHLLDGHPILTVSWTNRQERLYSFTPVFRGTPRRMRTAKAFTFWQDREIRFDDSNRVFHLRENTEEVFATFQQVEDSKGNKGHLGTLLVTNLRLIWWSERRRTINLSIGYYCVTNVSLQSAESKLVSGSAEALHVMANYGTSRFVFIFTHVTKSSKADNGVGQGKERLFNTVMATWRAYDTTRVYREIRVRTAMIHKGNVILLEGEEIRTKMEGVSSIGKDQGQLGTLVTTNLRVVWFALESDSFNVSVPFMQVIEVRTQESKYGVALVIETSTYAGSFTLGFRIDPPESLHRMFLEVTSLWKLWSAHPFLGIKVNVASSMASSSTAPQPVVAPVDSDDAPSVVQEAPADGLAAYYADEGQKATDRVPVYEPTIGLAVEKLRKGVTMQSLWEVVVS